MNIINKSFGKKIIFDDAQFEINSNCILIIGENGSGKTTLMKILSGLIKSYTGECSVKDNSSLLLDSNVLYLSKSGTENIDLFLNETEKMKAKYLINLFQMEDYIDKRCFFYSNGMKKKLSLVIALAKDKKYLLLDEPTNSLDSKSIQILKNYLLEEKKNRVIIIASHDMQIFDKDLIDEIFMIENNKIYSKNLNDYDYEYYRIKTNDEIISSNYEFVKNGDDYIFKINKGELVNFSKEICKYVILEMNMLKPYDEYCLKELYK